ncbi:MAG TPA: hypothetical protein V6C72_02275 [Chroococcales cyanobacterium]
MPQKDNRVTFYADHDVLDWYNALTRGEKTYKVNEACRLLMAQEARTEKRLAQIEKRLDELEAAVYRRNPL